ncbi:DsbA family protein [Halegenticoccus tardaugens]|uniref:DsbA family protein n=1 Tax=Halegenticoccus tardaugens TaxID=2071624 RepID=UPI0013E953CC|nr:thioredoxin domain-containing protein [Halegenticoccus tardaugens]
MQRKTTRRAFIAAAGGTALLGTSGLTAADSSNGATELTGATYPTLGTAESNPTATLYGNFKCPYTQNFVQNNLGPLREEFVDSGELNFRFRALAYEPDPSEPSHGSSDYYISSSDPYISEAAHGVWDVEPYSYWSFFEYMFEELISGTVGNAEMRERLKDGGVANWGLVPNRASDGEYESVVAQTPEDAQRYDVDVTPTLELGGEILTADRDYGELADWIDRQL